MKLEEMVIECKNQNEKDEVISLLKNSGCHHNDSFLKKGNYIAVYPNTPSFTIYDRNITSSSDAFYTYQKFMDKYSNKENVMNKQLMISRISAAKEKLNLGDSELSVKLGHNRNYISRVLHQENPSLEQMTKVVKKCNDLILAHYSEELKEEDSLNQKLPCGKPLPEFNPVVIADAKMVSLEEINELHETIENQKKELGHKNQALDKRNAVLENHIDRVNELELILKTTQEEFIEVVDHKDKEISKLQIGLNHATNQYNGKCIEVARLSEKVKKQASIYMIIIAILFIASVVGFKS